MSFVRKFNTIRQILGGYLFLLLLWAGWFMALPLQFQDPHTATGPAWHWFGGYHGFVEPLLNGKQALDTADTYGYYYHDSLWNLGILLFMAFIATLTSYSILYWIRKKIRTLILRTRAKRTDTDTDVE